jgi:predicted CXXCH cytochrome family protein
MSCHREMDQSLHASPFVHEPVMKECTQCHDPHASQHRMVTIAPSMQLCTTNCHEDVRSAVTDAKFKHSAVSQDEGCANCHNPHAGVRAALMKAEPVAVCLSCHDKPIERDGKQIVAAVPQVAAHDLHKHGPVREGSCAGCHDVHGSNHSRLLTAHYTNNFYEPFAVEHYDLCFSCHAKDLATQPTTRGATAFRDGEKNLHYVHVNKTKRGRTCSACHDTHASDSKHIVRDTVTFGQWQMPINFQPTATGGSCATGCHQTLRYDREKPVNDVLLPPDDAPTKEETFP